MSEAVCKKFHKKGDVLKCTRIPGNKKKPSRSEAHCSGALDDGLKLWSALEISLSKSKRGPCQKVKYSCGWAWNGNSSRVYKREAPEGHFGHCWKRDERRSSFAPVKIAKEWCQGRNGAGKPAESYGYHFGLGEWGTRPLRNLRGAERIGSAIHQRI